MFNFHKTCESEIAYLRQQVLYLQQKCDRLTEALVRKEQQIVMKLPDAPMVRSDRTPIIAPPAVVATMPTEPANTWANGDSWMGSQKISSPVRERKVIAPE